MSDDDDAWFEPKTFGYGAGLPTAWQGWVILGLYIAIVTAAALLLAERSMIAFFIVLAGATVSFLIITVRRTRGGVRWRWGDED